MNIQQSIGHFAIEVKHYLETIDREFFPKTNIKRKFVIGALVGIGYPILGLSLLLIGKKIGYPSIFNLWSREFFKIPSNLQTATIVQKIAFVITAPFGNILVTVIVPIMEEIVFRDLIQIRVLRNKLQSLLQPVSPTLAQSIDHIAMKVMRIGLTALLFSFYHVPDHFLFNRPREQTAIQLINTLGMGIGLGILRENSDLFTCTVAHGTYNGLIAIAYQVRIVAYLFFGK